MTNDLVLAVNNEPAVLYGRSMPQQEWVEHRTWIGARVEALLDSYWDKKPPDLVKAEIMADWMYALEDFSPNEVRAACRSYLSGDKRHIKPKPGDIQNLIWRFIPPKRQELLREHFRRSRT